MTLLLFLLICQTHEITLKGNPNLLNLHLVKGGYIGWSKHQFWHWDEFGNLIKSFGQRGEGPGEFGSISGLHWDGTYYWVLDGSTQESTVFSAEKFLYKQPLYFRHLIPVDETLFVTDFSRITREMISKKAGHPPLLRQINHRIDAQKIEVRAGHFFRKTTATQAEWHYNFKNHFIAKGEGGWYIINQQDPLLWFYDPEKIKREAALSDEEPSNIRPLELVFKRWKQTKEWNPRSRDWWLSVCLINGLWVDGERLLIAYAEGGEKQHLEIFDTKHLGPSKHHRLLPGAPAGVKDGMLYVWRADDQTSVRAIPL